MIKAEKFDKDGEKIGFEELDKELFEGKVYNSILHQVIVSYNANKRQGNAKTKTRAEVSATGAKPWKQKGLGRARSGSRVTPIFKGGGIAFGPSPRNYTQKIPVKIKRKAFLSAVRLKAARNSIKIIEDLPFEKPSTKKMIGLIEKMNLRDKVLIIKEHGDDAVYRSGRNIPGIEIVKVEDVNSADILKTEDILFTKESFDKFKLRLKKGAEK